MHGCIRFSTVKFLVAVGFLILTLGCPRHATAGDRRGQAPKQQDDQPEFVPTAKCFSADGKVLFVGGELGDDHWELQAWDWAAKKRIPSKGKPIGSSPTSHGRLIASPDGQYLAGEIFLGHVEKWRTVLWRIKDLKIIHSSKTAGTPLVFFPDRKGYDARILIRTGLGIGIWRVGANGDNAEHQILVGYGGLTIDHLSEGHISVSPDVTRIAIPGLLGVKVRNLFLDNRDRHYGKIYRDGHLRATGCAAFSPDMTLVATGATGFWGADPEYFDNEPDDFTVKLRDLKTGKIVSSLDFHKRYIMQILFTHDGKRIVTFTSEGIIRIWETSTARLLKEIEIKNAGFPCESCPPRDCFAMSPRANVMAGIFNGEVRLWDVDAGRLLFALPISKAEN